MLRLRNPSERTIEAFLDSQSRLDLTYSEMGATDAELPAGFVVDRTRRLLGSGEQAFLAARAALEQWRQFEPGWMRLWSPDTPIREGEDVAVIARFGGMWWFNACRIVYTVDQDGPAPRFGFAYGTLPAHLACGEERFLVEMDDQQQVWFDILAFSRPRHVLARTGKVVFRHIQKRFGPAAAKAMQSAVVGSSSEETFVHESK